VLTSAQSFLDIRIKNRLLSVDRVADSFAAFLDTGGAFLDPSLNGVSGAT
jgi:hypothetical protein